MDQKDFIKIILVMLLVISFATMLYGLVGGVGLKSPAFAITAFVLAFVSLLADKKEFFVMALGAGLFLIPFIGLFKCPENTCAVQIGKCPANPCTQQCEFWDVVCQGNLNLCNAQYSASNALCNAKYELELGACNAAYAASNATCQADVSLKNALLTYGGLILFAAGVFLYVRETKR